ncbi:MAG: N-6 DNA methylase, partial [Leuconostoc falkenbergense]
GYYTVDDDRQFETKSSNRQSWLQNLLVEKSLSFVSDDGWVYLVVPAALLSGDNAKKLLQFVTSHTQLKAFLQLPNDFFQDERAAKAILVLRKKSNHPQKEVLMGQYPSLKNPKKLQEFLQDIEAWVKLDKEVQ